MLTEIQRKKSILRKSEPPRPVAGEVHSAFSVLLAVEHLVVVRKAPALWKYLGEKNILGRWEFSRFPTSRQVPPLEA